MEVVSILRFFDGIDSSLGTKLVVDWGLLAAQCGFLVFLILREAWKKDDRNLFTILVAVTLLVLVQGQAWWTLARLQGAAYTQQLYHVISRDGARLANLYVALAMGLFLIGRLGARRVRPRQQLLQHTTADNKRIPYAFVAIVTLIGAAAAIVSAGGLRNAVQSPGQPLAGQSVLLIAVGMGKMPTLSLLNRGLRPSLAALGLAALTLLVILFNSRFLMLFVLAQFIIVSHYCRRPVRRITLGAAAVVGVLVMLLFGLYRDFNAVRAVDPTIGSTGAFLAQRAPQGVVDWFYSYNAEGFTGFAGILTYDQAVPGGIAHDYGISTLSVVPHLLPNTLRTNPALPFKGVYDYLTSIYPYHASIVSPGFEMAYADFGLIGVLALGFLLGYATVRLDSAMRARHLAGNALLLGVVSVQVLQVIRGTFANAIFFGLADVVLVMVFRGLARTRTDRRASLQVGSFAPNVGR
jgi:hypothetical protein